jgi:hypothetical protein
MLIEMGISFATWLGGKIVNNVMSQHQNIKQNP